MLAPLLPDGFRASAWPDLGPTSRQLLLAEILAANPDLVLTGSVDYESPREPLLLHEPSGVFISIAGQTVDTGSGLNVNVTQGTLIDALPWIAALALILVVLAIR